jgi:tetratricopeptide (TPR) repeat protein
MRHAIIIAAVAVALSAPALAQKIDEPSTDQRIISAVAKEMASAHQKNGVALTANGEYGAALTEFKKVIELDPTNFQGYVSRAVVYIKMGKPDLALVDVNEALRLDPKNADALSVRGIMYSSEGDWDKALADSNAAIALEPNSLHYNNRGFAYNNMNDYDRAIADLNEAIRLNPKSAWAYKNRAVSYEKKNQLKEASDDYDFALKLYPKLQEAVDGARTVNQLLAKGSGSQQIVEAQQMPAASSQPQAEIPSFDVEAYCHQQATKNNELSLSGLGYCKGIEQMYYDELTGKQHVVGERWEKFPAEAQQSCLKEIANHKYKASYADLTHCLRDTLKGLEPFRR